MAVQCAQAGDIKLPTLFSNEHRPEAAQSPVKRVSQNWEIIPEKSSLSFSTCTHMPYCHCQEKASVAELMPRHTSKNYKSFEECNRWAAFADAEALRRAEWDLWAKLRSQDLETAESVFKKLADKYQPAWREEATCFRTCSGMPYCQCQSKAASASFSHCTQMPYCQCQAKASGATSVSVKSSTSYKSSEERSRWAAFSDTEALRRAEWDLWAKLHSQDSETAESVFSNLADKYQLGWRGREATAFKKCSSMPYCQCHGKAASASFSHCTQMPYCQCQAKASGATSVSVTSSTSYKSSEERSRWANFSDTEALRRAEWDLWAKLHSQDSEGAENVFIKLADKHEIEWRSAAGCFERCSGMLYCQCKSAKGTEC